MPSVFVNSLIDDSRHDVVIPTVEISVRQFKEVLQQKISLLTEFPIPVDTVNLYVDGAGILDDVKPLSHYDLSENRPVLMNIETPLVPLRCCKCNEAFSNNAFRNSFSGFSPYGEGAPSKDGVPHQLNCGHAICLRCLSEGVTESEENMRRYVEPSFPAIPPSWSKEKIEEEQQRREDIRQQEKWKHQRQEAMAEHMVAFACPCCQMTSYWRRDLEWHLHESMLRLMHLKKRERAESEHLRGECSIKECGVPALFVCGDCRNTNFCYEHCKQVHRVDCYSYHQPRLVFPIEEPLNSPLGDFCCQCGPLAGSCDRTCTVTRNGHCSHDSAIRGVCKTITKRDVVEQLTQLNELKGAFSKGLSSFNIRMVELQTNRINGVEQIQREFNELIAKLERSREAQVAELKQQYWRLEMELLGKVTALARISAEVEAGMAHSQLLFARFNDQPERANCTDRYSSDVRELRRKWEELSREVSSSLEVENMSSVTCSFANQEQLVQSFAKVRVLKNTAATAVPVATERKEPAPEASLRRNPQVAPPPTVSVSSGPRPPPQPQPQSSTKLPASVNAVLESGRAANPSKPPQPETTRKQSCEQQHPYTNVAANMTTSRSSVPCVPSPSLQRQDNEDRQTSVRTCSGSQQQWGHVATRTEATIFFDNLQRLGSSNDDGSSRRNSAGCGDRESHVHVHPPRTSMAGNAPNQVQPTPPSSQVLPPCELPEDLLAWLDQRGVGREQVIREVREGVLAIDQFTYDNREIVLDVIQQRYHSLY